jgi:hypothetical protein
MTSWKRLLIRFSEARGQSLVETALFLPILIFMLAGIVEVSNLLITQNRVTTSSRMAAGFGAANFDHSNWANDTSGTAYNMGIVALNTITESMPLNADQWDIYSAHGLTTQDGSAFEIFESAWVYGNHNVVTDAEWTAIEGDIEADILESLQSECPDDPASCAGNIEFVVSVPFHELDTILGLPIWQWTGFQRVRGVTVMRVRPVVKALGCPILPIAVRFEQYSVYPTNWTPGQRLWEFDADPVDLFPPDTKGPTGFDAPRNPVPTYWNFGTEPNIDSRGHFERNTPGYPLWYVIAEKEKGEVFWARDATESGNFAWLTWDGNTDMPTLLASLEYPGNFEEVYPFSPADMGTAENPHPDPPGITGDEDHWLEVGEWVEGATGNMNEQSGRRLEWYIENDVEVALVVFQENNGEVGSHLMYRVFDFIVVKILGYSFGGNDEDKWIIFEFISPDVVCGYAGS